MSLSMTMDKRVTLQTLTPGQDQYGAPSNVWTNVATVWAGIADMTGREYAAAGGTQNAATTKITIRYRDGVVAAMRAVHGTVVYNVEAVLGQDRRVLLLMCSRGVSNG